METAAQPPRPSARRGRLAAPLTAWSAGLLLVFGPVVASGFREVPGGPRDARLVLYSLEHSYLWLRGDTHHRRFWDPPLFYPARNVAAYTDTMLSLAPFYWPWRALGASPDGAFQLWHLLIWSLGFAAFYAFLERLLKTRPWATAGGAFLFAFGGPRLANVTHPQLLPQLFVVATLFSTMRLVSAARSGSSRWTLSGWATLAGAGLALQLYGAVYPAVFLTLQLALAALAALGFRRGRAGLAALVRRGWAPILGATALALILCLPLIAHYRQSEELFGARPWAAVEPSLPAATSWLLMGRDNHLYGWLSRSALFEGDARRLTLSPHANGVGLLTLALAVGGLVGARRRPCVRLLVATALLTVLLASSFPGGWSAWRLLHDHLPGVGAIRAVARIGQTLLVLWGVGLALFLDRWLDRRRAAPLVLLGLAVAAEQSGRVATYDKVSTGARVERLAAHLEPGCRSFHLSAARGRRWLALDEDAMWLGIVAGVPTINGRYGHAPPGWPFGAANVATATQAAIAEELGLWAARHCLDAASTCLVTVADPESGAGMVRRLAKAGEAGHGCGGTF